MGENNRLLEMYRQSARCSGGGDRVAWQGWGEQPGTWYEAMSLLQHGPRGGCSWCPMPVLCTLHPEPRSDGAEVGKV